MHLFLRFLLALIIVQTTLRGMDTPYDNPDFNPSNFGGYVVKDIEIQSFYDDQNKKENNDKQENTSDDKEDNEEEGLAPAYGDYRLKPGDRLEMSVYGEPRTHRFVTVDFNGTISYLFINTFPVIGKSISQVRKELETRLTVYFREPILLMTLAESTGDFYTIAGEVLNPGIKPLIGNTTLLTALADSHGIILRFFRDSLVEIGDLDHAFLSRKGEYIPIDFEALIQHGDMSQNIPLEHGDYIYIPSRQTHQVFVLGEVYYPLTFEYFNTMTLTEAITEAGGVTRRGSSRVAVIRGSLACPTRYLIDVNLIWKGCARDFVLQPGDIVYVPVMQFQTLKEIVKIGVAAFVSQAANVMGTNAYLRLNPRAIGQVSSPVPVFPTVSAAPAPAPAPAAAGP